MVKKLICAFVLAFVCLCATARAQQPQKLEPRFKLDSGDAALIIGGQLDAISSIGKREANSLFRDARGHFSLTKNEIAKWSLEGLFLSLKAVYRTPGERRWIRIAQYVFSAGFVALAAHNFTIPKARKDYQP